MPYCLKCGSKVEENMDFCPSCGTQLKDAPPKEAVPDQKKEEQKIPAKPAKVEKSAESFIKYLVTGVILVTIGVFALLQLSNPMMNLTQNLTIMLIIIGVIIIVSAVYVAMAGRHPRITHVAGN